MKHRRNRGNEDRGRAAACCAVVFVLAAFAETVGGTAHAVDKPGKSASQGKTASRSTASVTSKRLKVMALEALAREAKKKELEKRLESLIPAKRSRSFVIKKPPISSTTSVVRLEELMISRPASPFDPGRRSIAVPPTTSVPGELVVDSSKAELKTDPEHERNLIRAEEFARRGEYKYAITFWQKVLDEATDTVMTRDDWKFKGRDFTFQKYCSVADEVERSLAKLPPKGLRMYRLFKDGEAQALLAAAKTPQRREEALSAVVRRFFLSSYGDDAAFELACRQMDRGEFVGASRMLTKILDQYPDPSVAESEILLRLAVSQAQLGERKAALKTLEALRKSPPRGSQRLLALIEQHVQSASSSSSGPNEESSRSWLMALGNPSRTGHMKSPAAVRDSSNLTEFWGRDVDLGFAPATDTTSLKTGGLMQSGSKGSPTPSLTSSSPALGTKAIYETSYTVRTYQPQMQTAIPSARSYDDLVRRWKQFRWRPAGQVLHHQGRLYYKSRTKLVCIDAKTNRLLWRSAWENRFIPDDITQKLGRYLAQSGRRRPVDLLDVQLFGDRIHNSMSIAGNLVLSIEGKRPEPQADSTDKKPSPPSKVFTSPYNRGQVIQRSRTNWLAAYDAVTGKAVWYRAAAESKTTDDEAKVGFLAAPVPYARLLLTPVTNGSEIWLYALDRETGKTVWKTQLCDEPAGGAAPWSPVGVAVDGGDAYVATGAGVIAAVDAMNGSVRWAFRYPRVGRRNPYLARRTGYGGQVNVALDMVEGAEADVVIPHGRVVAVMASDCSYMFGIDRRTGEFLWDAPLGLKKDGPKARYCLGVYGGAFYVGSDRVVRKYSFKSGGCIWEKELTDETSDAPASLGRGIVTEQAVFVPFKDSVLKLAHADGERLDQFGVVLDRHQPVGNLYSDGHRLFVLGPGRVSALGDIKVRLKALDEQVKAGDWEARRERMLVRGRLKNVEAAVEDLRAILNRLNKQGRFREAGPFVIDALARLKFSASQPSLTLNLLSKHAADIRAVAGSKPNQSLESLLKMREAQVRTALLQLQKKGGEKAMPSVLNTAPLCRSPHLFELARAVVRSQASEADLSVLIASLKSSEDGRRRLGVVGLSRIKKEAATAALKNVLTDPEELVRLEAAVALANRGDRDGLPVMVALLESPTMATRIRTASLLYRLVGKSFGYLAYQSAEQRAKAVKLWRAWVNGEGQTAPLKPVQTVRVMLGRTVVSDWNGSYVEEYDAAGNRRRRISVSNPTDVQGLPDGHLLVTSYSRKAVLEYDEKSKLVRTFSTQSWGSPYSVQRLTNGNTLVACYNSGSHKQGNVVEYDPNGKVVWRFAYSGMVTGAQRLDDGTTLVAVYRSVRRRSLPRSFSGKRRISSLSRTAYGPGKVLEVDQSRKIAREIRTITYPWAAQRLDNGHTLVADYSGKRVVEFNAKQQIVWQKTGLSYPRQVQRLPNGNTLVAHSGGVVEFDPQGRQIWRKAVSSACSVCRF